MKETSLETIVETVEISKESQVVFPPCPKCDRPIFNGLYCISCGTFIKKLPEKNRPTKQRRRRK